jgi:N6-L-threonylcarbamoyladenine synthase
VVLGIETTCDETAAAVVEQPDTGRGRILSIVLAGRRTCRLRRRGARSPPICRVDHVIASAMTEAGKSFADLDGRRRRRAGLIGGVIVGCDHRQAIRWSASRSPRSIILKHMR